MLCFCMQGNFLISLDITDENGNKCEVLMYANFDLENLFTPVDANKLDEILTQSGYDQEKTRNLVNGFREGFTLGYQGRRDIKIRSPNLKFHVGDEIELWNKVM